MSIVREHTTLILPDTSPLFSLAYASVAYPGNGDYLDLILKAGLPVYITDQVKWEATRLKESGHPIALHVDGWFSRHPEIHEVPTTIGKMCIAAAGAGTISKKELADQGEESVLQAIKLRRVPQGPYLFLFEEDRLADPSFFGIYPVHIVSTYGFLVGLEHDKAIPSADDVLERIRGSGRNVKADIIDRPTTKATPPAVESAWLPRRGFR